MDGIYRKNAQMVYKYLCGLRQHSRLTEELTQETFFQAVRVKTKGKGKASYDKIKIIGGLFLWQAGIQIF